jgi:hypothetical protein
LDGRLVIGILLLKHITGFSDEEVVLAVRENPYMQVFCGLESFTTEPLLDSSSLCKLCRRAWKKYFAELERETSDGVIEGAGGDTLGRGYHATGEGVFLQSLEQVIGGIEVSDMVIDHRLDLIFESKGQGAIASGFKRGDVRQCVLKSLDKAIECGGIFQDGLGPDAVLHGRYSFGAKKRITRLCKPSGSKKTQPVLYHILTPNRKSLLNSSQTI